VSRLDPEPDAAPPPAPDLHEIAVANAAAGPSVEMLKSLVEALNASIPAETPAMEPTAEAAGTAETAQAAQAPGDAEPAGIPTEPPAFDVVVTFDPAEAPPEDATTATAEPAESIETPAVVLSASGDGTSYEVELLARFEQMGDVPILPAELGAVVIFPPHDAPMEAAAEPARPQHEPAAAEPAAVASADAEANARSSEAQISESQVSEDQPIEEQTAELPPVDLDAAFDPDVCLFGSDDVDDTPAEPAPVAEAPADVSDGVAPPATAAAVKPAASPDPLMPIKAMSQEERIALFS
jgi:hypothetical protein